MSICREERCACFPHQLLDHIKRGFNDEAKMLLQRIEDYDAADPSKKTLLHYSVKYGNAAIVQHLIEMGCNVNAQDSQGITPLMLAIETANAPITEILLKNKANIYIIDSNGVSTFQRSFYIVMDLLSVDYDIQLFRYPYKVRESHRLILKMLIGKTNEDFFFDKEVMMKLLLNVNSVVKLAVVALSNIEMATFVLQNNHSIEFRESQIGLTALHCTGIFGNQENTKLLIERGANIEAVNKAGVTPLLMAVKNYNVPVVEILLKNNADIFSINTNGMSIMQSSFHLTVSLEIFMLAEIKRNYRLIFEMITEKVNEDFLRDKVTTMKALSNAAYVAKLAVVASCRIELASFILKNDYEINFCESKQGKTALHAAIVLGKLENTKFLIKRGANIHIKDNNGHSPLFYYTISLQYVDNESDILNIFFKQLPSNHQIIDVMHFLRTGTKETVKAILASGIDINASLDRDGVQPLQFVLMKNKRLSVSDIIELGISIDVHLCNATGSTSSLTSAVLNGNIEKIEYLLEHGADVNYKTRNGYPVLFSAAAFCFSKNLVKITELLLQFGADAQITSDNGVTLIDYLLRHSQKELRPIKPIVAHLAMLAAINKSAIYERTRNSINTYTLSKTYFDLFSKQLKDLKDIKLYGTVTLFELLHVKEEALKAYLRNEELFAAYKYSMKSMSYLESYYINILQRRITKAVKKVELEKELSQIIATLTMFGANVFHVIVSKIVSYLDYEDLYNLRKAIKCVNKKFII